MSGPPRPRQREQRRGTTWLFFTVVAVLYYGAASASVSAQSAQTPSCSDAIHAEAEKRADNLRTWREVYAYYRKYRRCGFDAEVAEGGSESIARLLVDKWKAFPDGAKLAEQDHGFREFLSGGVNATLSGKDLEAIRSRTADCPARASSLCEEIRRRANFAIEEQKR